MLAYFKTDSLFKSVPSMAYTPRQELQGRDAASTRQPPTPLSSLSQCVVYARSSELCSSNQRTLFRSSTPRPKPHTLCAA